MMANKIIFPAVDLSSGDEQHRRRRSCCDEDGKLRTQTYVRWKHDEEEVILRGLGRVSPENSDIGNDRNEECFWGQIHDDFNKSTNGRFENDGDVLEAGKPIFWLVNIGEKIASKQVSSFSSMDLCSCLQVQDNGKHIFFSDDKDSSLDNYSSWRRSMVIALNEKNKMKIVTRDFAEPNITSPISALWERNNDMIICWILDTVVDQIGNNLNFINSVNKLWVWSRSRYGVSKGLDTTYWGFLGVGTTFDIFQNLHILYLQYGVLIFSGYGV
ncbi:hypothetical protein Tco_0772470 [Tanacetum coccineum]|uniref:Uncharacterized protein n=1 Tax=Tanacetum coccineum TaxID=301880 RepID=A0ABQ4ZHZ5_9ASTR